MPDSPTDAATATELTDAKPKGDATVHLADEPLGDAGKRALDSEREARRDAESRAKAAERAAREATSDREKAIAEAKAETRREILAEANSRLLRAEVRAAAAGRFSISADRVVNLLDLSEIKVADDGTVDIKAIEAVIAKLLEDEPTLAVKPTVPQGSADGGRQGTPAPSKLDMNSLLRAAAKGK